MNQEVLQTLEYNKVKEILASYSLSYLGRSHVEKLVPVTDLRRIEGWLAEVEEAKAIVMNSGSVPIPTLLGIDKLLTMLGKGFLFNEQDFTHLAAFLRGVQQLKHYLRRKQEIAPTVTSFGESLQEMQEVLGEIERCITHEQVSDEASPELHKVRKKIAVLEDRLKKKLDAARHKYRNYLQDDLILERLGHYVIPVKKEHRKRVQGSVMDESSSGQTVFIEPAEVLGLQSDLADLRIEEEREKAKVLGVLTNLVEQSESQLRVNVETTGYCDFVFAKAKYAKALDANAPRVNTRGYTEILGGRHPLLKEGSVPLSFSIGSPYKALVITGPNTGGKTVSLKTVGLLTLMVQSGLLVPVAPGSEFGVFHEVLADIGDGQSIEHSLSTFSSHISQIVKVLDSANARTLILLDELATGTDPGEGVGLSIAILERLHARGATIVATTHFNEIKQYAAMTPGFENARMEFDVETLEPLYRLRIGEAGHSYAFLIARKLGLPEAMIARSREMAYRFGRAQERTEDQALDEPSAKGGGPAADARERTPESQTNKARQAQERAPGEQKKPEFEVGDRVWIHHLKRSGIVYRTADERGNLVLLVKKEKLTVNRKRISLYVSRDELYPADYDLDIVLESKEVRKKRKIMSKRHVGGLTLDP